MACEGLVMSVSGAKNMFEGIGDRGYSPTGI
jgi:hypothetical protein